MAARKSKKISEVKSRSSGGLVRRVVYLPPELAERLQERSDRLYRAESDLIREAIREYLEQGD